MGLSVVLQLSLAVMAIVLPEFRDLLLAILGFAFVISIPVWARIQEVVGEYI